MIWKKSKIKLSAFIAIIGLLLASLGPIFRVWAEAPNDSSGYASIQLNDITSLEYTENAESISANCEHGILTISGSGLYSYLDGHNNNIVAAPIGSNVTLDANGTDDYVGRLVVDGNNSNDSTMTLENISKKENDAPYIVDVIFDNNENQPVNPQPDETNDSAHINYDYNGAITEFNINGSRFDIERATAGDDNNQDTGTFSGEINYNYDDSGNVTFNLETLFIERITSLVINNEEYATVPDFPSTPEEILNAISGQTIHYTVQVPHATEYTISTTTTMNEGEYMTVGNFLWSYDEKDEGTDDYVGHGSLELINVKYDGVVYTPDQINTPEKGYLQWGENGSDGGALFPYGTEITVRLLPDAGYQLTSFTINGGEFEAGEEVGVYTFEVPRGNFHLGAHFTEVEDEVRADSDAIESGSITLEDGEIDSGTARLDVKDVELDDEDVEGFEDAAGDYEISTYLDVSLFKTTYKGTATDTWDDQINELKNDAVITLQLEDGIDGNEIIIVHQKHDGTYEVIPTTYDPVAHTITFKTSSFSNYAIASRSVTSPETGHFTMIQGMATSVFGAIVLSVVFASIAILCYNRRHDSE